MDQLNDYLKSSLARIEQKRRQQALEKKREREAKRKIDIRRNFLIGQLVCKYFPAVMRYQPKHNEADNAAEFAELEATIKWLSEHTEFLSQVKL